MDASTAMVGDVQQHAIPKYNSQASSTSPPPAYTPRGLQHLAQLQLAASTRNNQAGDSPAIMGRPPLTTVLDEVMDDDDAEGLSPISLRINTSVTVSKNNNLVCLSDTPASHANAIARAVVKAIQENSSGQCGIPMIDEEGRPRPVKIEVDAGITVEGSGNIVGNEAIINRALNDRSLRRLQRDEEDEDDEDMAGMPSKRRCTRGHGSQ